MRRALSWLWVKPAAVSACLLALGLHGTQRQAAFHFALLGDRTGEAQPGVYEEAWREAMAEDPAFVLTVGDTIQGGYDATVEAEWRHFFKTLEALKQRDLFLAPGNHDVWDDVSAAAYEKYSHHPLHYSFDWQQAHFSVLDNSESDELKSGELAFLEQDLEAHKGQPVKFIVSHRPSWLFRVVMRDSGFPLHRLAVKYGVQYVIAGHVHKMMRLSLDTVTYLSMASSGGHLREDKSYVHGWFFQHSSVTVDQDVSVKIRELSAPFGEGRVTGPEDWDASGLAEKR